MMPVPIIIGSQLRQTLRNTKIRLFFILGSITIFGILLLAWWTTAGQERIYLSDKKFQKLSLDVQCDLNMHHSHTRLGHKNQTTPLCTPYYDKYNANSLTTTDLFLDILSGGGSFGKSESDTESATSFVTLLGNIMMNGLPFAGLDDYVFMSDFINHKMDPSTLEALNSSPLIGGKFSNFMNVRKNGIRLVPDNCWTRNFAEYLQQTSSVVESLSVTIFNTMEEAIEHNSNAWVVVEIISDTNDPTACPVLPAQNPPQFESFPRNSSSSSSFSSSSSSSSSSASSLTTPLVTLRFHPASIPDTRNLMWSQRKQGGGSPTTLQSGQLLYFTSGFLTIQYEIQNFFSVCQLGGIPIVRKKITRPRAKAVPSYNNSTWGATNRSQHEGMEDSEETSGDAVSSFSFLNDYIASALLESTSVEHLLEHLVNISSMDIPQSSISVPLYDRAFPTRGYAKDLFWHNLGQILSVALIIYFSVPATMTAMEFSRDALTGQFDSLLTLPGVTMPVLCTSYIAASWITSILPFGLVWVLFTIILKSTSPLIPAVALLLMSVSLSSLAVVISSLTKNVETAVVLVPTSVFLLTLPGMVYYNLAFDVQRTVFMECVLCLLPPSACVLILRSLCTMESLSLPLLLSTKSLVSNVPVVVHLGILALNGWLFYGLALLCSNYQFQLRRKRFATQQEAHCINSPEPDRGGGSDDQCRFFAWVTGIWQFIMTSSGSRSTYTDASNNSDYELVATADRSVEQAQHPQHSQQYPYGMTASIPHLSRRPTVGLVVSDISKSFISTEKECQVEVLSHIQAQLHTGCVTTLLGSNGGGKTTLLRILGGFDPLYEGDVYYVQDSGCTTRRTVGWCSQHDALYEYLTIREHMDLFCALLGLAEVSHSNLTSPARPAVSEETTALLTRLDLLVHQDKYPTALSGGMKRRLSLALASLGDPSILLLDEPTSGCDSFTREMVRQDILSRKESCSVLISTHHIDDVEVISDRVWFLNDHSLVFDGPLSDLKQSFRESEGAGRSGVRGDDTRGHLDYVEFSTSNPKVQDLFRAHFGHVATCHMESSVPSWREEPEQEQKQDVGEGVVNGTDREVLAIARSLCWGVDLSNPVVKMAFRVFVCEELESHGVLDWSVSSPNVYDSFSRMYAPSSTVEQNEDDDDDEEEEKHHDAQQDTVDDTVIDHGATTGGSGPDASSPAFRICAYRCSQMILASHKISSIIRMRLAEMKLRKKHVLFSAIIFPFCMMLLLVFYCRDIRYPKLELTSSSIGGIGEILVSSGRQASSSTKEGSLDAPSAGLQHLFGSSLTWLGYGVKSNVLFDKLYKEYYIHDQNRWSSFVVDDTVEHWVQSSVRITDRSFGGTLTIDEAFSTLHALQRQVCNASQFSGREQADADAHDKDVEEEEKEKNGGENVGSDSIWVDEEILLQVQTAFTQHADDKHTNITEFCQFITGMEVGLIQNTSSSVASKGTHTANTSALLLQVSQSLNAKLTMLSNMTFFHDTPMFLKEVVPYIYTSRDELSCSSPRPYNHSAEHKHDPDDDHMFEERDPSLFSHNTTTKHDVYRLFSHPLDDSASKKKSVSPAFIQRGYLGAVIIIMYLLITSSSVLKFVTQAKKNGWKTQLHLAGVTNMEYWVGNFLVDFSMLFISFLAIFTAISIGGPPISSFYLDSKSEYSHIFLFSLCSFAGASVAANYCFAFLSVDPVSSQLLALFSSLCGGLFLRLFIALHAHVEPYVTIHTYCLWISPSYAFSSNMYDLFVQYVRHFSPKVTAPVLAVEVSLFRPLIAMCCQTVIYLCLTIAADTYHYPFTCWLHRWTEKVATFATECRAYADWPAIPRSPSVSLRSTVLRYIALSNLKDKNITSGGGERNLDFRDYGTVCDEEMALLSTPPCTEDNRSMSSFKTLERSTSFLSEHSQDNDQNEFPTTSQHFPSSTATNAIVTACDLNIAYKTGLTHSSPIIKQFNVCVQRGQRVALMGVNGGGKSTLYRTMTHTDMLPLTGSLTLGHFDTVRDHWCLGAANMVGYVPQEGGMLEFMTVEAAVDLFIELRKTTILASKTSNSSFESDTIALEVQAQRMKKQMYKILPKRYFSYYIFTLSGGNKQKLALLLSNIYGPSLLLLDECTSGIDPPAASEIIRYLSTLPSSQAILFASHRMEECVRICGRVLLLYGGRIQFDGPISEFSKVTDLFFQVDIEIEVVETHRTDHATEGTSPSDALTMTHFLKHFLKQLQVAIAEGNSFGNIDNYGSYHLFERMVRYSNSLVRFTFEKTKCPLSVLWSVVTEWNTFNTLVLLPGEAGGEGTMTAVDRVTSITKSKSIRIKSLSLRKMNMEEIFAAMVDAARQQQTNK